MKLKVMWSLLILSLVTATIATSGSGQLERRARTRMGYSRKIDICEMKTIGKNKALPPNLIPRKKSVSSTSIETWVKGDILGFEVYGENVYMSEVQEFIEASKEDKGAEIPNNLFYELTVRADTFYCDRKSDDIEDAYILNNFKLVRFSARRMVSNYCHIKLTQPDVHTAQEAIPNGKSSGKYGKPGGDGLNGLNGVPGKGARVLIRYLEAAGKMRITSNAGNGSPGTRGSKGGNGFRGKKGWDASLPTDCNKASNGGKGGDGSDGGDGGNGGNGGNGGHGLLFKLVTPYRRLYTMTFEIQGCGGKGGKGASGGTGGRGGIKGIGGKSYIYNERPVFKCVKHTFKAKDGKPGRKGKNGVRGKTGNQGHGGLFMKKSLVNRRSFDGDTWALILRKADGYYMHSKLRDAKKLYRKVRKFAYPGGSHQRYASLMFKRIKSGLTFYGFPADVVFAEDIDYSGEKLANSLEFAKHEDERIDKMLYRRHVDNQQKVDFDGLTNALVANNDGLKKENENFVKLQKDQRDKIVVGIKEIEEDIKDIKIDFEEKLFASVGRLIFEMSVKVITWVLLFTKPDIGKASNIFSQAIDIGKDVKACSLVGYTSMIEDMKRRAMEYSKFEDFKVTTMNVFDLTPAIFSELKKANSKSKIDKMKVMLFCLIGKTGKVGKALEAAVDVYLNYATARLSLIGKIYDIDLKTAECMIKYKLLEQRNKVINLIKHKRKFKTNYIAAMAKVRLTEDLIDTFKETERYALQLLYIYTDSLRFQTLWDFSECMKYYNPTVSIRADRKTYFDGYHAFALLRNRIDKFYHKWHASVGSTQEGKKFAFEISECSNKQFVENLRKYKSAMFYFDASRLCDDKCANFRLTKVRAEVMLKDRKYNPSGRFVITLEHLGDNYFYTGSRHEAPIILRQNKVEKFDLSSDTNNPLIKQCASCTGTCEIFGFPNEEMSNACTPNSIKGRREKRSYLKHYTPCRSPFARYKVNIPIGTTNKDTAQENGASKNITNIEGIRFVFEVAYWKKYTKGPKGCPVI